MGRTQSPASGGPDFDGAPVLVRQAEIALFAVLGDADMNRALWAIELRLRFQEIKRRARSRPPRSPRNGTPQSAAKPFAAYGLGFPVFLSGRSAKAVPLGV
jgi:hypothetical protein